MSVLYFVCTFCCNDLRNTVRVIGLWALSSSKHYKDTIKGTLLKAMTKIVHDSYGCCVIDHFLA